MRKNLKRILALLLVSLMLFAIVGCSDANNDWGAPGDGTVDNGMDDPIGKPPSLDTDSGNTDGSGEADTDAPSVNNGGKTLIVYFSNSGNTHKLTGMIEAEIEADVLRLIPADPYEWENLFERAQDELNQGIRPELTGLPEAEVIAQYDTILVGFPIWWYDLPMPVWTFLEAYDLSGKTIIPYFTHNGSSSGAASVDTIEKLCPNSTVKSDDYLSISGNSVDGSENKVKDWLKEIGLTK